MTEFAHRRAAHQLAVRRTGEERWYAEELFARFEVLGDRGHLRRPDAVTRLSARRARPAPPLRVPLALTAVTVLAQIAYPLAPDALARAASACSPCSPSPPPRHPRGAPCAAGPGPLRLVLVVVPGAFLAEAVGVATGFPFGHYDYSHRLGPLLAGVPLLVPLAWLMMAYPCLLMARLLVGRFTGIDGAARVFATGLVAGGALAAWDVFLDPQMVAAGNWTWRHPAPGAARSGRRAPDQPRRLAPRRRSC